MKPSPKAPQAPVTFIASIPTTATAIRIHGEGGARLELDIAEDDLEGFLPARVMRGRVLRVTLEVEQEGR